MATNYLSSGETLQHPYGPPDGFQRFELRERVALASGAASAVCIQTLPPRCRIIAAQLLNITGVNYVGTGDGTNTANQYAVIFSTSSSLTTGTTNGTSSFVVVSGTNTSAFTAPVFTGPTALANTYVTNTVPTFVHVVPVHLGTQGSAQNINIATNTNGHKFYSTATASTAGAVGLSISYETFPAVAA